MWLGIGRWKTHMKADKNIKSCPLLKCCAEQKEQEQLCKTRNYKNCSTYNMIKTVCKEGYGIDV